MTENTIISGLLKVQSTLQLNSPLKKKKKYFF